MLTLKEVRDKANEILAPIWRAIQDRQAAYYAAHGCYWQGFITHSAIPADGVDVAPDRLLLHPTDQRETWVDVGLELPNIPFAIKVDVYKGPNITEEFPTGEGYSATVYVRYQGTLYSRTAQHGPEIWRVEEWREVTEESVRA